MMNAYQLYVDRNAGNISYICFYPEIMVECSVPVEMYCIQLLIFSTQCPDTHCDS